MRIKMKESMNGSNDGINVEHFEEGKVYEVSTGLGNNFIGQKVARVTKEPIAAEAEASTPDEPDEDGEARAKSAKAKKGSPENKDAGNPDENKEE